MDGLRRQAGQGDRLRPRRNSSTWRMIPCTSCLVLGKRIFSAISLPSEFRGRTSEVMIRSSPTCLWLKFQCDDGFAKRAALKDAPDAVEFRLQPLEGQFLPDDLESCEACASDGRAAALGSWLKFILNRR